MKTLSEDITLELPTTKMQQGYVNTLIYHNNAEIFAGRTYIPGNNSSLYVNINDFVIQNHGKNDRLKLNDAGKLVSTPLDNGSEVPKRWEDGQVGNYKVSISQDTSKYGNVSYSASTNAVCGYDYINENLKPTIIENDGDSELGRLLQGCGWQVIHIDEYGSFSTKLLPRIPPISADNFGLGLQIWTNQPNNEYALRASSGNEYNLGPADCLNGSNQTFITLRDLYSAGIARSFDSDSSIYLKYQGSSGDEFGDWVEAYTLYTGKATLNELMEGSRAKGTTTWKYRRIPRTSERFKELLQAYIKTAKNVLPASQYNNIDTWNTDKIIKYPNDPLFYTENRHSSAYAETNVNNYTKFYTEDNSNIIYKEDFTSEYSLTPQFNTSFNQYEMPSEYIGKCPIAIIEGCYSRYYLAWMDRYGDYMSQPFEGKYEYSEDFEKSEMKDYKLKRRIIHNEIQPKWKLNSTWINEEFYPFYEAIFTSPYLLLYDTKTDRAWNVILSDNSYFEKTFKNQKKLFNLEINVEANTKQNYIF